MRVVIIGAGEIGSNLARSLSTSHIEVVVVDIDEQRIAALEDGLDVETILGSGADPGVLREAGLDRASLFIAVTDRDETNMMATSIASQYLPANAKRIARIRDRVYLEDPKLHERFGLDVVINPEGLLAEKIRRIMDIPDAHDVLEFEEGRVLVVAFRAGSHGPLCGKTVAQLGKHRSHLDFVISAILRPPGHGSMRQKVIIPRGKDSIQAGDLVYFVIPKAALPDLCAWVRPEAQHARSVLVGGGGENSIRIADALSKAGYKTRLMIPKADQARAASERLEKVLILNADCAEFETLADILSDGIDTYVAASKSEAVNALTAMMARRLGVTRTFTVTNRFDFMRMIKSVHDGVVLNPFDIAAAQVLRAIHTVNVLDVHLFAGEDAEAFELIAPQKSPILGVPLKDAKLPTGSLAALIVRDGDIRIPHGGDAIQAGDRVLVFCRRGTVAALERLVEPHRRW
ncbi:MAG: Trk system potassium transporter TrkA [Pseudomonadota bacterium]